MCNLAVEGRRLPGLRSRRSARKLPESALLTWLSWISGFLGRAAPAEVGLRVSHQDDAFLPRASPSWPPGHIACPLG